MSPAASCLALLALAAAAHAASPAALDNFEKYVAHFGKVYTSPQERLMRQELFEARLADAKAHNAGAHSFKKGINHMTDWTEDELSSMFGFDRSLHLHHRALRSVSAAKPSPLTPRLNSKLPIPDSLNWAALNATTPVKNQGGCGSCWSFAGTEAIESDIYLETGEKFILAPQLYVDCVSNTQNCGGQGGCQGAIPELLFEYAIKNGARNETQVPYQAQQGMCNASTTEPVAHITGFVDVVSNDYTALMLAVARQPVAISVAASSWATYESGVMKYEDCDADIDHAVLLVGYGTDEKLGDYWIVQNSWGPNWGEDGFIRLERSTKDNTRCQMDKTPLDGSACRGDTDPVKVCGTCGILSGSSYPTGGKAWNL